MSSSLVVSTSHGGAAMVFISGRKRRVKVGWWLCGCMVVLLAGETRHRQSGQAGERGGGRLFGERKSEESE